jgi:hypothetical protein
MEPEGSLPCSQKLATGSYPEPADYSSPYLPYLHKVHLNVILLDLIILTTASRTALGPTQPPVQWVQGALSWG